MHKYKLWAKTKSSQLYSIFDIQSQVQIEKIQLSSFGKTNITDFAQPISLNGVMAVPRKKEFSRSFPANLSLYVNFTFFDTGGTTARKDINVYYILAL